MAKTSPASEERWLTLGEACRLLEVNASTLRQWADHGVLTIFRTPGKHRRFLRSDIQRLLETGARPTPAPGGPAPGPRALRYIQRRLDSDRAASMTWLHKFDEASRARMRLLGRHLVDVTLAWLAQPRRRNETVEEVRAIGHQYGRELAQMGLSYCEMVEAFIFFRNSLLDSLERAPHHSVLVDQPPHNPWRQVESLTDELLLAMSGAYERSNHDPPA
ncbi:MAG: helix-turn-helix domain-containing protein [Chloroflexi bacterium]|nr:helix-turn-helix domain-containing protein [Chloroflexota bacterium]